MNESQYRNSRVFSNKKVSIARVINILRSNGISTDEDQAKKLLDFLYLIAKTYNIIEGNRTRIL